jgi:hypothetical protein
MSIKQYISKYNSLAPVSITKKIVSLRTFDRTITHSDLFNTPNTQTAAILTLTLT